MIELDLDADAHRVVDEVKSKIDAITTFPIETEKPIIRELTNRAQVVDTAVSGDGDRFTERVRDELTALPGITPVECHVAVVGVSKANVDRLGRAAGPHDEVDGTMGLDEQVGQMPRDDDARGRRLEQQTGGIRLEDGGIPVAEVRTGSK